MCVSSCWVDYGFFWRVCLARDFYLCLMDRWFFSLLTTMKWVLNWSQRSELHSSCHHQETLPLQIVLRVVTACLIFDSWLPLPPSQWSLQLFQQVPLNRLKFPQLYWLCIMVQRTAVNSLCSCVYYCVDEFTTWCHIKGRFGFISCSRRVNCVLHT